MPTAEITSPVGNRLRIALEKAEEVAAAILFLASDEARYITGAEMVVDGGMTASDWAMQFLSDILGAPVDRPVVTETTALGAAYLAGLAVGFWESREQIAAQWGLDRRFEPQIDGLTTPSLGRGEGRA